MAKRNRRGTQSRVPYRVVVTYRNSEGETKHSSRTIKASSPDKAKSAARKFTPDVILRNEVKTTAERLHK